MGIQFILGPSGSGKTEYMYEAVIKSAIERPEQSFYFIVPEQFTLQTQKDLVIRHPNKGILNVDVLSLERLAHKASEKLGGEKKVTLRDAGKNMIVKRVLGKYGKELKMYAGSASKKGFVEQAKSLISEFLQYGVDEETIMEMIESSETPKQLKRKLSDALMLYKGFNECLGENYVTGEGIFDVLAENIEKTGIVNDAVMYMDGFTGFTPSQYGLLRKLFSLCEDVYISFTLPREDYFKPDDIHSLFYLTARSSKLIEKLALSAKQEILDPIFLNEVKRYNDRKHELAALENNLFRYGKTDSTKYKHFEECLNLQAVGTPEEECRFVATKVLSLLRKENMRYRDIAVVCSDMDLYAPKLVKEFEKAGIECFADMKKNLSENICVVYIKALLEIAEFGLKDNTAIAYIKSPLSGWDTADAWLFENYIVSKGIKLEYRFKRKFDRPSKDVFGERLEQVEELRKRLNAEIAPIVHIFKDKDKNVSAITEELLEILNEKGIEEKLSELAEMFRNSDDRLHAKEYEQAYRVLTDTFEQFKGLLGNEKLSVKEYKELIETGFSEAKVGLIPQGSEQILIGDVERTRLNDIKVLFFMGVNDGKVPGYSNKPGMITDVERKKLIEIGYEIAPDSVTKASYANFYLYTMLTKPKERLYITYCSLDDEGNALKSSLLINRIKAVVAKCVKDQGTVEEKVEKPCLSDEEKYVLNDMGERTFYDILRDIVENGTDEETYEIFSVLYNQYSNVLSKEKMKRLFDAAIGRKSDEILSKETSKALFGEKFTSSVSRIELFAACHFAHFLKFGLELDEKETSEVDSRDIGNVYHEALKTFTEEIIAGRMKVSELSETMMDKFISDAVNSAVEAYKTDVFTEDDRQDYLKERMKKTLTNTVSSIAEQLKRSDFVPEECEKKFNLSDCFFELYGAIDRFDVCDGKAGKLIKIVDYKSSDRDFDMTKFYYGLSVQLAVYMTAVIEEYGVKNTAAFPAGMYYCEMNDPELKYEEIKKNAYKNGNSFEEQLRIEKQKAGRLSGLTCMDKDVLIKLDNGFDNGNGGISESYSSDIIPVSTKKGGELSKSDHLVSGESFNNMMKYLRDMLHKEGDSMLSGDVAIKPYKLGKHTGCDYCEYKAVCGFDSKLGYKYRQLSKMSRDDVLLKIGEKYGTDKKGEEAEQR